MKKHLGINPRGHLTIGGMDVVTLARRHHTPLYLMDENLIRDNCKRYIGAAKRHTDRFGIAYAAKAFMTGWICSVVESEGFYIDVVSGGEIYTALRAGFPADKLLFHGNNKSSAELMMALRAKVGRFVVDGFQELQTLDTLAKEIGDKPKIMLRISPDVLADTHIYTETGMLDSKFGFAIANGMAKDAVGLALSLPNVEFVGLHSHIGSQIMSLDGPVLAAERMADFVQDAERTYGIRVQEINLGGGLGISYTDSDTPPSIETYVDSVLSALYTAYDDRGLEYPFVFLEPGRSIVGEAGITVYTAGTIKQITGVRTYVSVDGGMADNPRPALYGAEYRAVIVNRAAEAACEPVALAGRCCESGDILIKEVVLPRVQSGDFVAVLDTGAYNYSMASNYNRIPRPAVVAIKDGSARVVVRRETYADVVSKDVFTIPVPSTLREAVGASMARKPRSNR